MREPKEKGGFWFGRCLPVVVRDSSLVQVARAAVGQERSASFMGSLAPPEASQVRDPEDHINTRILHLISGSPLILALEPECQIPLFTWSSEPLEVLGAGCGLQLCALFGP